MIIEKHGLRPAAASYVAGHSPALAMVVFAMAAFLWTFQNSEQ